MNQALSSPPVGAFKPIGHVVVAFPTEVDSEYANAALIAAGFGENDITPYTQAKMLAQMNDELARRGNSFLIVRARTREATETIAEVAVNCNAVRARRYSSSAVEELIPLDVPDGRTAATLRIY